MVGKFLECMRTDRSGWARKKYGRPEATQQLGLVETMPRGVREMLQGVQKKKSAFGTPVVRGFLF